MNSWIESFLSRRGLTVPSGTPLYAYRASEAEFLELESMLRERLQARLRTQSLEEVAVTDADFGPLFVVYAAEWWQRRYDGTGWAWGPILRSLGVEDDTWSQFSRSDCVTRGLAFWRLKVRESRGLRFLGSIAFNGGLPMQLLASARGNIGAVLSRVLRLASDSRCDPVDVQRWVESLERLLPLAYRQPQIHILLADMILAVLRLKESAGLRDAASAIETADRVRPGWRQEFPLPIEDAHARGLLEQMLREAVGVKVHAASSWIQVIRTLARTEANQWELRSDFLLPDYAEVRSIVEAYKLSADALKHSMTVQLRRGVQSSVLGIRRLAGQDKFRLDRRPVAAVNGAAAAEHLTLLSGQSGEQWVATADKGSALSPDLVWVFGADDDSESEHRLLRQGGGAIAAHEALVTAPTEWKIEVGTDGAYEAAGDLPALGRRVHRVRGVVSFVDPAGYRNRIRCGQAAEDATDYELRGYRVWNAFLTPRQAFRGVPRLHERDRDGRLAPVAGVALWRRHGGAFRNTLDPDVLGPVDAIWPNRQEPKWRDRVVILPEESRIESIGSQSATKGRLVFRDWGLARCSVLTAGVSSEIGETEGTLAVDLDWAGDGPLPEWVELQLSWRGNPFPARLQLPFPSVGVRAFDADGKMLEHGRRLVAGKLHGVRLLGYPGELHRAYLDMQLEAGGAERSGRSWQIVRPEGATRVELALIDYLPDIQALLADADLVDASVRVTFRVDRSPPLSFRIARYSCAIEPEIESGLATIPLEDLKSIAPATLTDTEVRAIRMDLPAEEPIALIARESEGIPVGAWGFPWSAPTEGAWLVYPSRKSALEFRPVVWPIEPPVEEAAHGGPLEAPETRDLRGAIALPQPRQRKDALDAVIDRMSRMPSSTDWGHAEQLATSLGHLPLSALDLWRRFGRSTSAMAAMAMRLGSMPIDFIARFGNELPFVWETIPYEDWCTAIAGTAAQTRELPISEELARTMLDAHLNTRIEAIASLAPGVRVLLEAARARATNRLSKDVLAVRNPTVDGLFAKQLFIGETSDVQRLMQFNSDAEWPASFTQEVHAARQNAELAPYLCASSYAFHDSVINAPVLLALEAVSGKSSQRLSGRTTTASIREHRAFDPQWFDEAFHSTIVRCISTRKLSIETLNA